MMSDHEGNGLIHDKDYEWSKGIEYNVFVMHYIDYNYRHSLHDNIYYKHNRIIQTIRTTLS